MKKKLLKILEKEANLTPKQIAKMLGTSEKEVKKTIAELEKKKVIRGYRTIINWEKAQIEKCFALVDVKVTPRKDIGFDDVAEKIYRFPEVKFVYLVSGLYDLSIMVEGKTMRDIAYFISNKLATIDRVENTITHFIMKKYKEDGEIIEEKAEKRLPIVP